MPPGGSGRSLASLAILGSAWFLLAACGGDATRPDPDRGPIEDAVGFADRIHWPGFDFAEGRVVPRYNGFGGGRPSSRWIFGTASPFVAASFWFCSEGDSACPLDASRRLSWGRFAGRPVFEHVPGDVGYSPFWQMWKVTVQDEYEEDRAKTSATVQRLADERTVTIEPFVVDFGEVYGETIGPRDALVHGPLVLADTRLAENGDRLADGETPMLSIPTREGWWEGYRVSFFDFSVSEGVFPSDGPQPRMPTATLYSVRRHCVGPGGPGVCALDSDHEEVPVDETVIGVDVTGDGDLEDTNNVVGGLPCEEPLFRGHPTHPGEPAYSPLRSLWTAVIDAPASPDIDLIDTTGDQRSSDIRSLTDLYARVDAGEIGEPARWPDEELDIFLHASIPVPSGSVPFPCPGKD